jgi:hypothetical protein
MGDPDTHPIGGWVDPIDGLGSVERNAPTGNRT